jgi:hypothetical protein
MGPIDLVIMKVDSSGIFQWKETYGSPGIDVGYELINSVDGNGFIITGQTYTTSTEYYLLKLDQNGLISVTENKNDNYLSDAFPNPANDEVFIRYDLDAEKNSVLIFSDISGKKIKEEYLHDRSGTIRTDVSRMAPGLYFYGVEIGGRMSSVKKLIVTY